MKIGDGRVRIEPQQFSQCYDLHEGRRDCGGAATKASHGSRAKTVAGSVITSTGQNGALVAQGLNMCNAQDLAFQTGSSRVSSRLN